MNLEQTAKNIAKRIALQFGYDAEKQAVIAYGLSALFQMLFIFTLTSVIGILGGFWVECMIIFGLVGVLRRSEGGAHSSTFTGCTMFSVLFICLMAFLSAQMQSVEILAGYATFSGVVYLWAFTVAYKKVPVDTPNKPIVRPEKIKRLRRNAFGTLGLFLIATTVLYAYAAKTPRLIGFAFSVTMSVVWQTFMLTRVGHRFIEIIDRKLVDF